MKYLLDTDICIYSIKDWYDLQRKPENVRYENCSISEITVAELKYGIQSSTRQGENRRAINTFLDKFKVVSIWDAINTFAIEKARLRKVGKLVSDFDLLIGSSAIYYDLTLVTNNTSHFERLKKIKIENWTAGIPRRATEKITSVSQP